MADRKRCCCNCGNNIRCKDGKGFVTHCQCAVDGQITMDTREKLIELIEQAYFCNIESLADFLIANGVTVQKWIPVTERLPEEDKDVLVFGYYHETFQTLICHYRSDFKGQWFTSVAGQQVYEVTHWMPLPEAPKGE